MENQNLSVISAVWLLAVVWLVRRLLGGGSQIAAPSNGSSVPEAAGGLPVLGHALEYKADAPRFLLDQCARVGSVFRINLAGKRMVIVGAGREAIAATTNAAETVLSARDAVLAIGFREALGDLNVREGTDFHKRVLKAWLPPAQLGEEVARLSLIHI